jgi:hypothetical protein
MIFAGLQQEKLLGRYVAAYLEIMKTVVVALEDHSVHNLPEANLW